MKLHYILAVLFAILVISSIGCNSNQAPKIPATQSTATSANTTNPSASLVSTPEPVKVPIESNLYEGRWQSNETDVYGAILEFTVKDGQIVYLVTRAFPIQHEEFTWLIEAPINIQDGSFQGSSLSLPETRGQGAFLLEGKFISADKCEGVMKWPKGYFWVDFTMPRDITIPWTAIKK